MSAEADTGSRTDQAWYPAPRTTLDPKGDLNPGRRFRRVMPPYLPFAVPSESAQ
jgi:hypothetical protein